MKIDKFTFYIFIAFGIFFSFLFYWYFPLTFIDSIYTKYQDSAFMDQNFYAYHSKRLCEIENLSLEDFNITWSSFGVTSYLTYACKALLNPMGYIVFNILFFIFSLSIFIKSIERTLQIQTTKFSLSTIFLISCSMYYIALPGKEIFSYCGVFIFAAGIVYFSNKNTLRSFIYIFFSILIVSISRPHEGLGLFVLALIFFTRIKLTLLNFLICGSIASFFLEAIVLFQVNNFFGTEFISVIDMIGFKSNIDKYLSNENIIIHFLLGPIRMFVICFGVLLTSIIPFFDFMNVNISWYFYKSFPLFLRLIEMSAGLYALFMISSKPSPINRNIITIFLYYIFFVTFFGIEQRSRYLFAAFPFFIIYFDIIKNQGKKLPWLVNNVSTK